MIPLASDRLVAPIPPSARLLHIGLPKSGTTALQNAASAQRAELLAQGVRYPGRGLNHRIPAFALMGKKTGWATAGDSAPSLRSWRALMAEITEDNERRALLSHELICESVPQQAERFATELGDQLHVLITVRGYATLLASNWQQFIKAGNGRDYESWLRAVLSDPPNPRVTPGFHVRNDVGAIVERWSKLLGPDRVIVVVADKDRRTQLTDAIEDLLDLSRGLLQYKVDGGFAANRSLSMAEVELLRRVNNAVRPNGFTWEQYQQLVRMGMVARLQENRAPGDGESRIDLPEWAAERATERARQYAARIAASGCRVVGDVDQLFQPIRTGDIAEPDQIPMDAAVEAVAGALSGRVRRSEVSPEPEPAELPPWADKIAGGSRRKKWRRAVEATSGVRLKDVVAAVAIRVERALRRRLRRKS